MSGRLSMDSNSNGAIWNYGPVPTSYAPDGSLNSASHGRRSSIYRAQNSTLFSAFEEDGMALTDLPEEDESEEDERDRRPTQPLNANKGRSLVGKNTSLGTSSGGRDSLAVEGSRHPAFSDTAPGR